MADVKVGMAYDGDPERNPFMPAIGVKVAICEHEPRPLHINQRLDPEPIPTTSVYWANLCRECYALLNSQPNELRLTVIVWQKPGGTGV